MIIVKKLKRPSKKSGRPLQPGEVANLGSLGIKIVNVGKSVVYVDRKTPKK
jgi:hypothetical protein